MTERKEEEAGEFKVVDRRLFTPEGERRPESEIEPPPKTPVSPKPPPAEPPRTQPKPEAKTERTAEPPAESPGGVQFEHLVMSLVTSAMFQMGMAAKPGEIPPPPDLPAAQETIEILAVLQQKTKGNLTREEEEILRGSLYELRMAFVELTRAAGRRH